VSNQRDRRNMTDADLLRCVKALDQKGRAGRPSTQKVAPVGANSANSPTGKSAERTAELLGTSARKVERARAVIDKAPEEVQQAAEAGDLSINQAYRETARRASDERSADAPTSPYYTVKAWETLPAAERARIIGEAPQASTTQFNRTNDNIEWAHWSWNPVTGCDHGCPYCYARDIAVRFYTDLPEGERFMPVFRPSRLPAPRHTKVPRAVDANVGEKNVFVGSMTDLFGKWVPQDWIDAVFQEVVSAPQWNFLFLTKFPQRLAAQDWPTNAWVGTTVDTQARVANAERSFANVKAGIKWLSCEPMLERLTFTSLEMFDWVVIGASSESTQTPEFQSSWEWLEHLIGQARAANCQVYVKPNLKSRPREYPESGRG
jgi:protein gp37